MSLPIAQSLPNVSPSRLRLLRECFLHVAFAQSAPPPTESSDAQLVGSATHASLAALVRPGPPFDSRLEAIADDFKVRLDEVSDGRPVRRARIAAARLARLATNVCSIVNEADNPVTIRCEEWLTAHDGQLAGVLDLVVESPSLHAVIDYKTGVVSHDGGEFTEPIVEQLHIYCVLERERSGDWPKRALIMRLGGETVTWEVDPAACDSTARIALELRADYERYSGATPPASPSPSACRYCPYSARCEAFWGASSTDWADSPIAVRGAVKWAERSIAGGTTLCLTEATGAAEGDIVVCQLPADMPDGYLAEGATLALVGLWPDRDGTFRAGSATRIWSS